MARKYSKKAQRKVKRAMQERKRGTLRSGRSGKKVTSRKQAIAIGLSQARRAGAKVPRKRRRRRPSRSKRSYLSGRTASERSRGRYRSIALSPVAARLQCGRENGAQERTRTSTPLGTKT